MCYKCKRVQVITWCGQGRNVLRGRCFLLLKGTNLKRNDSDKTHWKSIPCYRWICVHYIVGNTIRTYISNSNKTGCDDVFLSWFHSTIEEFHRIGHIYIYIYRIGFRQILIVTEKQIHIDLIRCWNKPKNTRHHKLYLAWCVPRNTTRDGRMFHLSCSLYTIQTTRQRERSNDKCDTGCSSPIITPWASDSTANSIKAWQLVLTSASTSYTVMIAYKWKSTLEWWWWW
jgi:hypothetical protein